MNQLKLVTSVILCTSVFSAATYAKPIMKDEPLATAPYNWTGFYAGVNAGIVKNTMNMTDTQATSFNATIQQAANPQFTGGLQVGYRRQLDLSSTTGVYGAELSTNFSNASFEKQYGSSFGLYQLNAKNNLKNVSLLEVTGGIAADRALLFIAAGLSWVNITGSVTNVAGVPFFNSFNVSKNVFGSALSAGAEYAFTDKLSARFKVDVVTPNVYSVQDNTGDSFQISNNIVQATLGVNYKFG